MGESFNENYANIKIDFHIHTALSLDGVGDVTTRIKKAKKEGLNIIAITDHNTIHPKIRGKAILEKNGIKLIVGEEISTDKGEIIGLFLRKVVKPGKLEQVLDEIKSQEAIVILPHPFKRSRIINYPEFLKDINLIEAWNGRTSFEKNYKSLIFADINKKPICCGSDAHFSFEIGRSILEIFTNDKDIMYSIEVAEDLLELVKNAKKFIIKGKTKRCFLLESFSQFVKFVKGHKKSSLKNSFVFALYEIVGIDNNSYDNIKVEIDNIKKDIKLKF